MMGWQWQRLLWLLDCGYRDIPRPYKHPLHLLTLSLDSAHVDFKAPLGAWILTSKSLGTDRLILNFIQILSIPGFTESELES